LVFGVAWALGIAARAWAQADTQPGAASPGAGAAIGPLQGKWEDVDQRFVFLTVDLASTENSLAAVNKALLRAGDQQAMQQQRASDAQRGNDLMDRNGGGPVPWRDFYGRTARDFYFQYGSAVNVHAHGGRVGQLDVAAREADDSQLINRPPQLDYIYRANINSKQRADDEVAKIGNKIDGLLGRRHQLEAEQSALWCKIALRALTSRELGDKPIYRYQLATAEKDDAHRQAALAIAAGAKFLRTVNELVDQSQKALDGDQGAVYPKLADAVSQARTDMKSVWLAQPALQAALADDGNPLGQFYAAVKRLESSSQNMADAYRLAQESDRANDFAGKENFRLQLQSAAIDFAATVVTADQALADSAADWKVSADTQKPIPPDHLADIFPATQPLAQPSASAPPSNPSPDANHGQASAPIPTGLCTIVNKGNGLVLWVTSDNKNRGNWLGLQKAADVDNQEWLIVTSVGRDGINIISKFSDRCTGVSGGSSVAGTGILQWTPRSDAKHLNWRLEPVGDTFKIINNDSGQCLSFKQVKGKFKAVQEPWEQSADQLWEIQSVK
jgi:hypothetical protein